MVNLFLTLLNTLLFFLGDKKKIIYFFFSSFSYSSLLLLSQRRVYYRKFYYYFLRYPYGNPINILYILHIYIFYIIMQYLFSFCRFSLTLLVVYTIHWQSLILFENIVTYINFVGGIFYHPSEIFTSFQS